MIAYKLLRKRKDGTYGPLYIERRRRVPIGEWVESNAVRTKGYKYRPGWHCCHKPEAPHIKDKPERVWAEVEIKEYDAFQRPENQGGLWYIAKWMKINKIIA